VIRIENLRKRYGQIQALDCLSTTVNPGVITGLLGPNGCGKTTLIKSILGLVVPDSGDIYVNQKDVRSDYAYRADIGYMPQNPDFPGNLRIQEMLNMLEDIRQSKATRKEEMQEIFDVTKMLKRRFFELSGGMKQRVAAVSALMFDSPILILDEPTVGLDPVSAAHLKDLIRQESQNGKVVFLVTHIIAEMEQLARDMIFLLDGKLFFSGSVETLKAKYQASSLEQAVTKLFNHPHL
jgi:Cu-processing system ATP-binding protein